LMQWTVRAIFGAPKKIDYKVLIKTCDLRCQL